MAVTKWERILCFALQVPTLPIVLLGLLFIGIGKIGEYVYDVGQSIQDWIVEIFRKHNART